MRSAILFNGLLYAAFLFLPAGTWRWPHAWIFLAALLAMSIHQQISVGRVHRALLDERAGLPIRRGQAGPDRILLPAFMASLAAVVAFIALDRFRWRLMDAPPAAVSSLGLALYVIGSWIQTQALRTNAFASLVVRHQEDRGQRVIDSGVYSIVRHPMYAGFVPTALGMALWLESYAGAVLALVPIGILAVRIVAEERFLRRSLDGYADYAARVRYRLVPGIW